MPKYNNLSKITQRKGEKRDVDTANFNSAPQEAALRVANMAIEDLLRPGRLLRVKQIVGHILPVSRSHFLAKVKSGEYPAPIKLSQRVTCWRSEDIIALIKAAV